MSINTITEIDRRQWILQNCELGKRILDIGGNNGYIFIGTQFFKYTTTVDLDKYDIPNFYQMDAHNLQFPDKLFDIALLAEILEHVEDPVQVLKEAKRVAKRILITVPDEWNWDKSLFPFQTLEEDSKRTNRTIEQMAIDGNPTAKEFYTKDNYKHLFHNRYYTEETLKQDLENAGIENYNMKRLKYGKPQWSYFTVDANVDTKVDTNINTKQGIIIQTSTSSIQIDIPKGPTISFGSDVNINSPSKGKLRVALISTPFFGVPPQKYGGLEQVVWDLAEGLDELGHLVAIFGPEGSKTPKHGSLVVTGPAIDTVGVNWFEEEEKRYRKWKDIISSEMFDIIHDHTWFGFPYFHKMNNLRLRVIHTHHGGYQWNTAPPFPKPNLVSISNWMKLYTEQYFKQKGFSIESEYIYNGINIDRYSFDPTIEKTNRLLYVGRFSVYKQPLVAMRVAMKANLHIDLIGGTFVEDPNYMQQIESMSEGKDITIHKDVSHEFKIQKMQEAKALILPSKMNEPFGLVAVEAMACGTPIICTRDGALPEIIVDGVTGFICDTDEQMIEAINKVDTIKPDVCRKHVEENFSRLRMAKEYQMLYQRMMQDKNW